MNKITKAVKLRSAKMCFQIASQCQKEGKGDPRILQELVRWGNQCLKKTGLTRKELGV